MKSPAPDSRPLHEIRKDGKTMMAWRDPSCGYSPRVLKQMKSNGYRLYIGGKPAKV